VDLSSLFSNPTLLILLAVVALSMFGGGSLNLTELIMSLLQSLKLIPQPQGKASEQVYRGYTRKAWETLRSGNLDGTKDLLLAGMQATEAEIAKETAIQPAGIGDTIKEWLKSPIFLIAIAVGAFLIFGGGSCKKTDPAPQDQESIDVTPTGWSGQIRPAVWRQVDGSDATYGNYDSQQSHDSHSQPLQITPVSCPCDAPPAAWWSAGPVRRVASAPLRAPVRIMQEARPVRRVGAMLARVRPLRWLFGRR